MPPKRGLAVRKKPDPNQKYIFLDSDGEHIPKQEKSPSCCSSIADDEENKSPYLSSNKTPPKLSNSSPVPQRCRQDSASGAQPTGSFPISSTSISFSPSVKARNPSTTSLLTHNPLQSRNLGQSSRGPRQSTRARPSTQPHHLHPHQEAPTTSTSTMAYIQPSQQRHMRACMVCSVVRTYNQFMQSGCPNCEHFLELTGNSEAVNDCTSQVFDGLMTVADTSKSWVARYQRLEGYAPGVYAVQVEGILPEDVIIAAENAGVHYVPRDGSASETLPVDQ